MKTKFSIAVLLLLIFEAVTVAQTQTEVLSNLRIIKLSKAGMDEGIILTKIESSTCKFDLTDDGLISLKNSGVPNTIIQAMMNKASSKKPFILDQPGKSPIGYMPVPAFLNEINYYDASAKTVKPLEKTTARIATKGLVKAETFLGIQGEKSSFRIKTQDSLFFLVNLESAMGDPTGWFTFYKADLKKGNRVATWVKTSTFTGKSSGGDNVMTYNVRKLNDKTFQIVPVGKMDKGEYFFFAKGTLANYGGQSGDAFAFGID